MLLARRALGRRLAVILPGGLVVIGLSSSYQLVASGTILVAAADAKAASNCMSGFAVSLAAGLPL